MSNHKTFGVHFLKRAVGKAKQNKNVKFISIPVEKADEILSQSEDMKPNGQYFAKQNSVRAAALILCVDVYELCQRMNGKSPKQYMNDIAELKNRIKQMELVGDKMAEQLSGDAVKEWNRAKNL